MDMSQLPGGGLGGLSDIAANGKNLIIQIGNLINTLKTILPFSGAFGTFTMPAASSVTVTNGSVTANSIILPMATNSSAGTLMGSNKYLYVSSRIAGTSFTFSTSSGASAAGTETFAYVIINPS